MEVQWGRKLIPEKVVLEALGNPHRSTLHRWVKAGKFPAPVQTAENSKDWFEDEVDEHISNLPRVNYAPQVAEAENHAPA